MADHLVSAAGYLMEHQTDDFLPKWAYSQILSELVRAYAGGTLSIIYDKSGKCCGVTTARKLLIEGKKVLYINILHTTAKDGLNRFLRIYKDAYSDHLLAGERKKKIKLINPKIIERI